MDHHEDNVIVTKHDEGRVWVVALNRPSRRNAVDGSVATSLFRIFTAFDDDSESRVAILTGRGGFFCAGADLQALASSSTPSKDQGEEGAKTNPISDPDKERMLKNLDLGPEGCTRLHLRKPTIAAIEGPAVAGGLELALWCDLRVAAETAVLGVFCRRWGVPLIDGGTVRLPRLIGASRALDLILTGRAVSAQEAYDIGLVNRLCGTGNALETAMDLARLISSFPQTCMRNDRASMHAQESLGFHDALIEEFRLGKDSMASSDMLEGAQRFSQGSGRHGSFDEFTKGSSARAKL